MATKTYTFVESVTLSPLEEDLLARLTQAAYDVALRRGFGGTFLDVQLDLWAALRHVLEQDAATRPAPEDAPELLVV